ncbi:tetratricopeptide repeat protein [Emticicia sp. SJ17W-69]|uniref:tetratricopeptide repeat protein n=1 Tax=Emticicia sp. SJ17W-69 TaxID=3421657 RepID=UPI003EB7AF84
MQKLIMKLHLLKSVFIFCSLLLLVIHPRYSAAKSLVNIVAIDDEYDRYKKKGDEYLKKGDYINAKKQYKNCLEVPGFENDEYARKKIVLSDECIALKEQAESLLQKDNATKGVPLLKEVLGKNPEDIETKKKLTDYWKSNGNKYYGIEKFQDAQNSYKEALNYAEDKYTLAILIQNCEDKLNKEKELLQKKQDEISTVKQEQIPQKNETPIILKKEISDGTIVKVKNKTFPKILVGIIGVGTGTYAYLTNSKYSKELSDFKTFESAYDPDGDGFIRNSDSYQEWQKKYDVLKTSQKSKQMIINTCLGISATALIVETILLLKKPKTKKGLSFRANPHNVGLAIRYDFQK